MIQTVCRETLKEFKGAFIFKSDEPLTFHPSANKEGAKYWSAKFYSSRASKKTYQLKIPTQIAQRNGYENAEEVLNAIKNGEVIVTSWKLQRVKYKNTEKPWRKERTETVIFITGLRKIENYNDREPQLVLIVMEKHKDTAYTRYHEGYEINPDDIEYEHTETSISYSGCNKETWRLIVLKTCKASVEYWNSRKTCRDNRYYNEEHLEISACTL